MYLCTFVRLDCILVYSFSNLCSIEYIHFPFILTIQITVDNTFSFSVYQVSGTIITTRIIVNHKTDKKGSKIVGNQH